MTHDLVMKNATVVTATSVYEADVAVDGEQIAAVGRDLAGRVEIDATGRYLLPGAVDIHVHHELALPDNFTSSDTFHSGTRAAAFGGTTAIVDFVEARPEEPLLDALAARRAAADPQVAIDYGLHMTITPPDIEKLDQVSDVVAAGCATFKLYMAYGYRLHDGQLLEALTAIGKAGGLAVVHAENWDVIQTLVARNLAAGRTAPRWHPRSRPAQFEAEATGRLIELATFAGAPVHVFHVSAGATVEKIAAARTRGLPVTGETCPQYLFLNDEAFEAPGVAGALPICSPPIRQQAEQEKLWRALSGGQLQVVATDHAPFTRAEKERGLRDNYSRVPGGVPSIEMRLAGVYQGVRRGVLSLTRWVDLCCTTPARVAGFRRKGEIAVGYDADLVIFDPDLPVTLSTDLLHEQVDWTPYEGLAFTGWPETTISRGEIVVRNGEFLGRPGRGRFVQRRLAARRA